MKLCLDERDTRGFEGVSGSDVHFRAVSPFVAPSEQSPLSPAQAQRSPGPVRMPSAPVSPLIQVSRVRPPIDPSRLPPSSPDPYGGSGGPPGQGPPGSGPERFLQPLRPPGLVAPPPPRPPMRQASQDEAVAAPPPPLPPPPPRTTPPHTPSPTSRVPPPMSPLDPYAQMPGTPRPQPTSDGGYHPGYMRAQQAAVPKVVARPPPVDPYAQPPGTPMPQVSEQQYSPQQGYGATPRAAPQASQASGGAVFGCGN